MRDVVVVSLSLTCEVQSRRVANLSTDNTYFSIFALPFLRMRRSGKISIVLEPIGKTQGEPLLARASPGSCETVSNRRLP